MSTDILFSKRNQIVSEVIINFEFNCLEESFSLIEDEYEILQENAVTEFIKNIIDRIKEFFDRMIDAIKNFFKRGSTVSKQEIKEAEEILDDAKKTTDKVNEKFKELSNSTKDNGIPDEDRLVIGDGRDPSEVASDFVRKMDEKAKKAEELALRKEISEEKLKQIKKRATEANKKAFDMELKKDRVKKMANEKFTQSAYKDKNMRSKGYRIHDKKLTMRNIDEKESVSKLLDIYFRMIVSCMDNRYIESDFKSYRKQYEYWFYRGLDKTIYDARKGKKIDITPYNGFLQYMLDEKDGWSLYKTINLVDFNIEFYKNFLKELEKTSIDVLNKMCDNRIKRVRVVLTEIENDVSQNKKDPKALENAKNNLTWATNELQQVVNGTFNVLMSVKKEIEGIIKYIVKLGNDK